MFTKVLQYLNKKIHYFQNSRIPQIITKGIDILSEALLKNFRRSDFAVGAMGVVTTATLVFLFYNMKPLAIGLGGSLICVSIAALKTRKKRIDDYRLIEKCIAFNERLNLTYGSQQDNKPILYLQNTRRFLSRTHATDDELNHVTSTLTFLSEKSKSQREEFCSSILQTIERVVKNKGEHRSLFSFDPFKEILLFSSDGFNLPHTANNSLVQYFQDETENNIRKATGAYVQNKGIITKVKVL